VAFSNSFFEYGIRMAVKRKSGIRNYADLAGKTVSTTAGTSDERILREMSLDKNLDLRIISAQDHAEGFNAVKTDRAVAFVMDDPLLYGQIAEQGRQRVEYMVTGDSLSHEAYGCMLRKGDPAFKRLADDVIADMQRSGEGHQPRIPALRGDEATVRESERPRVELIAQPSVWCRSASESVVWNRVLRLRLA
jgi:ABC-type amino acid transport substrate-binding protein